jgi:hypothetical protein
MYQRAWCRPARREWALRRALRSAELAMTHELDALLRATARDKCHFSIRVFVLSNVTSVRSRLLRNGSRPGQLKYHGVQLSVASGIHRARASNESISVLSSNCIVHLLKRLFVCLRVELCEARLCPSTKGILRLFANRSRCMLTEFSRWERPPFSKSSAWPNHIGIQALLRRSRICWSWR